MLWIRNIVDSIARWQPVKTAGAGQTLHVDNQSINQSKKLYSASYKLMDGSA